MSPMTNDEFLLAYFLGESGQWSDDLVWLRYIEAIATLRRLPEKWIPAAVRTVMPPYARALDEEFGPPEATEEQRAALKREAINRMEEVFEWNARWLANPRYVEWAQALMAHAEVANGRVRVKTVCEKIGVSPPTLYKWKNLALQHVTDRLRETELTVGLPDYDLCLMIAVK